MSVRRLDSKNEMCVVSVGTCVSEPDSKSPGTRKVLVYTCMCTIAMCILTCVIHVPSHRRSTAICWSNKSPSRAALCVCDIFACVLHVPSHKRSITMVLKQQESFLGKLCIYNVDRRTNKLPTLSHSFISPKRIHGLHWKCLLRRLIHTWKQAVLYRWKEHK